MEVDPSPRRGVKRKAEDIGDKPEGREDVYVEPPPVAASVPAVARKTQRQQVPRDSARTTVRQRNALLATTAALQRVELRKKPTENAQAKRERLETRRANIDAELAAAGPGPEEAQALPKFANERENAAAALVSAKATFQQYGENLNGLMKLSLMELTAYFFGVNRTAHWKARYREVRELWELMTPDEQCQSTVGWDGRPCWICGFDIDGAAGYGRPEKAECEHILPIAQAVCFLSLYSRDSVERQNQRIYTLEYDWAHSHCNQTKNDDVYVEFSADGRHLEFLDDEYDNLMDKILRVSRHKDNATGRDFGEEFMTWLRAQIAGRYADNLDPVQQWKDDRRIVFQQKFNAIQNHVVATPTWRNLALLAASVAVVYQVNHIEDPEKRRVLGLVGEPWRAAVPDDAEFEPGVAPPRSRARKTRKNIPAPVEDTTSELGGRRRRKTYRKKKTTTLRSGMY